jgi:hypothetical protein
VPSKRTRTGRTVRSHFKRVNVNREVHEKNQRTKQIEREATKAITNYEETKDEQRTDK